MPPLNGRIDEAAFNEISLLCGVDTGQIEDVYDCTPFQRGIAAVWGKVDSAYTQRYVLSLSTDLDLERLLNAVNEVVARNGNLRTRIVDSQQLGLVQVVLRDDPATCSRSLSTGFDRYVEEDRGISVGLATPLLRSTIIEDARRWILTLNHAIFDHSSLLSLVDDVARICRRQLPSVHAPFKQFVDYCGSVHESEAKDFWAKQFMGTPSVFPSTPVNKIIDATSRTSRKIRTPSELTSPALLPVYLECAWALLAHAYGGGDSVAYGVVYSGRGGSSAREIMDSTLGPTIVTLPTEVTVNPEDTVGELLKRRQLGRQAVQGCGAAMHIGLNKIRKVSESARKASEFQTLINILHSAAPSADSSAISFDYEDDVHRAYAINLMFNIDSSASVDSQGGAGQLEVVTDFDESLVSLTAMNRLLVQLEHVLQTLARAAAHTRIGELTLLSSRDRLETLKWNKTIAEPVDGTLNGMVREMAIAHPQDTAVDAWDGRLTYLELVTMADDLADTLRQRGVTHQSVVPCFFEFSRWAIVAALAVLSAGGVCLALDSSYPRARHQKLLELTKSEVLLCSTALAGRAHGLAPSVLNVSAETVSGSAVLRDENGHNHGSEQNAYIIFTSGSTGTPKGVVLQHRALATSLTSIGRYMGWCRGLRALASTSYVWDASIAEIFGTLTFGGCVCIPSVETRESGLADYINAVGVEWVFQTPTGMRNLSPTELPTVRTLVSGGERILPDAADTWGSEFRLVNGWGPCESSIFATFADLGPQAKFPETIGRPVGCAVWIAGPTNPARLVPIGAVGELIIESATVAKEYLCNDEATTAAFIPAPAWAPRRSQALTKARRFYRTGDLGKYNDDGSICFIGRRDHQVKIRGQRLELGEIESVIAQFPAVRTVTVASHAPRSQTEVFAVLALNHPRLPRQKALEEHGDECQDIVVESVSSVRSFAASKLPSYMVPTQWLVVQDLPKSVSGKVDRQAIGDWLRDNAALRSSVVDADDSQARSIRPPVSATEKTLRTIWSNVLDVPESEIGRDSSFLRLGGDSITAMQVATRIRRLGLQLSVETLMQHALAEVATNCKEFPPAHVPSQTQGGTTGTFDVPILDSVSELDIDKINQWIGDLNIPASSVEAIYPCSAVQEGILFAQLKDESDGYRNRFTLEIKPTNPGDTVSAQDLELAWYSVCKAHPILRTVFASGFDEVDAFQQIVLRKTHPTVMHKVLDNEIDILSFLHDHAKPCFSETTPPHCLTVVQREVDSITHVVFDMSHVLVDTRTIAIIVEQLISAYQHPSQLPAGPNFSEYIVWAHAQRIPSREYWLSHLSSQKPCLLPTQHVPQAARPSNLQVTVPYENAAELIEFCKLRGVTVASFVQVVWSLVLKRYSVEAGVTPCFGCLHSGRHVIDNAEDVMGPLLTMLITRLDTNPAVTPIELMNQARLDSTQGSDKAGCSLSEIHEQMGLGASPLFNTIMSINPSLHVTSNLSSTQGYISVKVVQVDNPTEYPVTVVVTSSKDSLNVQISCKPEAISSAFAEEMAQYFATVAKALLISPEQPLATTSLFQDISQHSPTPLSATKQPSQFWTEHLSRVQQVPAFPFKARAHPVLKDHLRSIKLTAPVPKDGAWATIVLQASWALCLSRLTGNKQVLFGVAVERPTDENINPRQTATTILPYAAQLTESSTPQSLSEDVRSWVQGSRPFILEGRDYLRTSRGELGSAGQVDNILLIHAGGSGAKFALQPLPSEQRLLAANRYPDDWGCGLAISCAILSNKTVSIQASFDSLLMDPARADLILRQYEHCIVQMFQNLGTEALLANMDSISAQERSIMRQWSSKPFSTADMCVHDEISQRATEFPNNAAINAWDGEISYKELDDLSTRLAVHLVEAGVQIGTFVPLFFAKSAIAVVAMLAVMKSGGVFVPMDPKHPEKRLSVILAELDSPVALCSSSWRAKLGDLGGSIKTVIATDMAHLRGLLSSKALTTTVGLEDICYVIYTSGSTGKPKGTIVDHSNTATIVRSYRLRLGMTHRTRTLQYVAFTFDVSIGDILMTLLSGGCLFMPTEEEYADAAGIAKAVNRTSANWLCLTPSLATLLLPEDAPTIQTLVLIGEAMRADIVDAWADRVALVNAYGPSEATIESSCRLVRRNTVDHNNIGTPNACLYWIVDENDHDRLLPIGCPGELLIQGPNVTQGYLHSPEKTEAVFIKNPAWMKDFVGEATEHRLYKTGDIVQQHVDGSATYLGRNGPQIKLRGQRIDVGETEHHVLETLGHEWQAAVDIVHWDEDNREPSLVCFLARRGGHAKAAGARALLEPEFEMATNIRTALSSLVPIYMVPDFYLPLRKLPSTSSDKTDRNALRSIAVHLPPKELRKYTANNRQSSQVPNGTRQSPPLAGSSSSPQAPQTSNKLMALRKAWSDVLNIPSHSIDRLDDWFSIGGNSVKAMRLVAAARKGGLKLTVADVFNNPVLADLELVASFVHSNERSSWPQQLIQTRNENLFPRICARAPFLALESIESATVATDAQAWMIAVGEVTGEGFINNFHIDSKAGLDVARLTRACAEVTRHHPLLRTVFFQLDEALLQIVLKDQCTMLIKDTSLARDATLHEERTRKYVPYFYFERLSSDGRLCHRLRLRIHHALYDAMFLELILNDIASSYCGRTLTTGLPFHAWIAQLCARDFTTTKAFWEEMLHKSSMTSLQPPNGPCRHEAQSGMIRTSVPIEKLRTPAGTEASVLKAAWATVLSRELGVQDVVFCQGTANRSSEFLETDQVLGPCVNFVPVRAYLPSGKKFTSLVQEIDAQHRASVPHHDLGFRQIIRECTEWPSWTRHGSAVLYQNHGSSIHESGGSRFRMEDECTLSGYAEPAETNDVWVIAQPSGPALEIYLRYIPGVISEKQAERLAKNLTTVLETGHLEPLSSKTVSPADSTWSLVATDSDGEIGRSTSPTRPVGLPTERAQSLVTKAWREVKLLRDGVLPEVNVSMFDCGADVVSALLLSRVYQRHDCDFSVADIVRNPTQMTQAAWLDGIEVVEE